MHVFLHPCGWRKGVAWASEFERIRVDTNRAGYYNRAIQHTDGRTAMWLIYLVMGVLGFCWLALILDIVAPGWNDEE